MEYLVYVCEKEKRSKSKSSGSTLSSFLRSTSSQARTVRLVLSVRSGEYRRLCKPTAGMLGKCSVEIVWIVKALFRQHRIRGEGEEFISCLVLPFFSISWRETSGLIF